MITSAPYHGRGVEPADPGESGFFEQGRGAKPERQEEGYGDAHAEDQHAPLLRREGVVDGGAEGGKHRDPELAR